MWNSVKTLTAFFIISIFYYQNSAGSEVLVPPGKDTLPDSISAGNSDDIFILENGGLYEISRTIALNGTQQIRLATPSTSFQDQAIVQSYGGTVSYVYMRAQNHFYDFPGDHSDPGGRWYWLPLLSGSVADPADPGYVGPHVRADGTIILDGLSSAALEGETELNAWSPGANPANYEKIECSLDNGLIAYGNNYVEGLELRGFRYAYQTYGSRLELKRCKWIGSETGVKVEGGDLVVNTCWGTGGSQRVHGWRVIKTGALDPAGKRKILSGQDNGQVGDVLLINSAFYDMFDGILGEYPKTLEIKNCLFDCPRCDDAIQIHINYGSVYSYRTIFMGTGPSWNQDGTNANQFLTEECILNPGREMYVPGTMRDRHVLGRHNSPEDPHSFIRCTFFNHNPLNSAGNEFDFVLGAGGRGADIGPHLWHDCLIYRVSREGRACAKLGRFYEQGITDIKGTVIIDANSQNDPGDSFYDGGSFTNWKNKNDPDALYIEDFNLSENQMMDRPNIGAILAGREVGAVASDAATPYGNVGPDWLLQTTLGVRNITIHSAELYWDAFDSASVYDVRYRTKTGGEWVDSTDIADYQLALTELLNNTAYEWQIRSSGSVNYIQGPGFKTLVDSSLQFVSIIALDSIAAEENQDTAAVLLERNRAEGDVTVYLQFSGTASTQDFEASLSDSVVFSDGDSLAVLNLIPIDDDQIEGWESFEISIAQSQSYNRTDKDAVSLILLDNDRWVSDTCFIETDGEVVMEAEHYHLNDMRLDPLAAIWEDQTKESGFIGEGYITTQKSGDTTDWQLGCEVGYHIKFKNPGWYQVWLRRYSALDYPNTVWVGMDDRQSPNQGHDGVPVFNPFITWMWVKVDSIEISNAAGIHTFNVRRHQTGYRLDRIVLRRSSAAPDGDGPPESEQGSIATKIENQNHTLPVRFELYRNYPNPFNPVTHIPFALPQKAYVTIDLYDLLGRKVKVLFEGFKEAGYHHIRWDTKGRSSGVYIYRFHATGINGKEFTDFGKCVLLK